MTLLVIAALLATIAFVFLMQSLWARKQPKSLSTKILASAVTLLIALAILAASGRMHWIAAVGAAVVPFLRRSFSLLRYLPYLARLMSMSSTAHANSNASGSQQTETSTQELRMRLDHESGDIDGEVLVGRHEGRALSDLSPMEIKELHLALKETESRRLLEAYADRYHPTILDPQAEGSPTVSPEMTHGRALKVLGLSTAATKDEIVAAHRRLIQRMHPDRGGSSFLAAELNAAKKFLMEE
tara:strand:- start:1705 stop:2430 length:726 start_codon:yes stop_codon:yes gene_type:complete